MWLKKYVPFNLQRCHFERNEVEPENLKELHFKRFFIA